MKRYTKRNGFYATTVTLGYTDEGKPIKKYFTAKTQEELEKKRSGYLFDSNKAVLVNKDKYTFGELYERWKAAKTNAIEYRTLHDYEQVHDAYLERFDKTVIGKIAPADIQKLIDDNSDHPRTCKKIMIELKQIIDLAISDDMLDRTPIRKIIVPKAKKKHKRALTEEEVKLLNNTKFAPREKLYLTLIQFYGLRKEEALALTPADLAGGFVNVNKAIVFKNNKPYIKSTKSTAGERKIPILNIHKHYFAEIVHKGGLYCFTCASSNDLITEQSFKCMYYSIIKKLKLTANKNKVPEPVGLTSHIFRHNYATMLYYAGVGVKDAQYLLGHATSSVTLDIYTHLDNENKAAKNKLETYLKNK